MATLHRRPVYGHTVNLIVAIIASVLSGFVIYANKLLPTTLINKLEFEYVPEMPPFLITYPSIDSGPNMR